MFTTSFGSKIFDNMLVVICLHCTTKKEVSQKHHEIVKFGYCHFFMKLCRQQFLSLNI